MAESSSNQNILANSINGFALEIYKKLSNKEGNLFLSPYSISVALSMCYVGAKEKTHDELKSLLFSSNNETLDDESVIQLSENLLTELNGLANNDLSIKNFEINQEYLKTVRNFFKSDVENLDFSEPAKSAKIINDWVENNTKGKIKDLINQGDINSLTKLILVNAIYFKGNWAKKFQKEQTKPDDFHLSDGSNVKVDMMQRLGEKFKYKENPVGLEASVCSIPYLGDKLSMTIILPNEGVSLDKIENNLKLDHFNDILGYAPFSKVQLYIPKFKLEHKIELSRTLSEMGAPTPFKPNEANFTGIYDKTNELFISDVIHQAVVEVNEEGTEAAAATAIIMRGMSLAIKVDPVYTFKCNRPFIFMIHDNINNCILLIGKYSKPN